MNQRLRSKRLRLHPLNRSKLAEKLRGEQRRNAPRSRDSSTQPRHRVLRRFPLHLRCRLGHQPHGQQLSIQPLHVRLRIFYAQSVGGKIQHVSQLDKAFGIEAVAQCFEAVSRWIQHKAIVGRDGGVLLLE